jgi:serine/threonine protein phosphatase PrpC
VPLVVKVYGRTDVGLVRSGNEDNLLLDQEHQVYAVCDGMGGHQAGEVASQTAVDTLTKVFSLYDQNILGDPRLEVGRTLPPRAELLLKAVRLANRAVFMHSAENPKLTGMGTTVVSVALEADIMAVVHVGDSRAYRLRERELEPLTRDHSWIQEIQQTQNISAEEASSVVGKNIITRALGVRENVEADLRIIKVRPGDQFIMCSDGLCGFADDDEIFDVATRHRGDIKQMAESLVQMANDRGGSDNVTVVTMTVEEVDESPLPELEALTFAAEDEETTAAEDDWLTKLAEADVEASEEASESGHGAVSRWVMLLIFLLFAIIAVAIVYTQFH